MLQKELLVTNWKHLQCLRELEGTVNHYQQVRKLHQNYLEKILISRTLSLVNIFYYYY